MLQVVHDTYQVYQDAQRARHRAEVAARAARRAFLDPILPALRKRIRAIEKITGRGFSRFSDSGRIKNVDIIRRRRDGMVLLRIEIQNGSEREPPCDVLLMPLDWLYKSVEECCALTIQLRADREQLKRECATACLPVENVCREGS